MTKSTKKRESVNAAISSNVVQFYNNPGSGYQPVSGAGDVNQDGIPDFLIASPGAYSPTGTPYAGAVSLVYGRNQTNPFPSSFPLNNLGALGNTDGVVFYGESDQEFAGNAISGAGDVNQDGIADFLIGAPEAGGSSPAGYAYLLYGRKQGNPFSPSFPLGNLGSAGNQDGVMFYGTWGVPGAGMAGAFLSGTRDVNQDGIDDFLIGASLGDVYLLYGRNQTNPFPPSFQLTNLGSTGNTDGVVFYPPYGQQLNSVGSVGDVNQDGIPDFLVGGFDSHSGYAYLLYGRNQTNPFPPSFQLSTLGSNGNTDGVVFTGGSQGDVSLSGTGDINGDKIADFLIGAPGINSKGVSGAQGGAYLIYGRNQTNPFPPSFPLSTLGGVGNTDGVLIFGTPWIESGAGQTVSGTGDINGDGCPDLLIGAPGGVYNLQSPGIVYVVYGRGRGLPPFPPTFSLDTITQNVTLAPNITYTNSETSPGIAFFGQELSQVNYVELGQSVSGLGDINQDGFPDMLIAAPASGGGSSAYLVYGQPLSSSKYDASATAPHNRKLLSLRDTQDINVEQKKAENGQFISTGITAGITKGVIGLFSAGVSSLKLLPGTAPHEQAANGFNAQHSMFDLNIPAAFLTGSLALIAVFSLLFYVLFQCSGRKTQDEHTEQQKSFSM